MHLYQPEGTIAQLFDVNNIELVGMDCLLGGTDHCVVSRDSRSSSAYSIYSCPIYSQLLLLQTPLGPKFSVRNSESLQKWGAENNRLYITT